MRWGNGQLKTVWDNRISPHEKKKTRRYKITDEIWRQMKVSCFATRTFEYRPLQWYDLVRQMPEHRWSKRKIEWSPEGRKKTKTAHSFETNIGNILWLKGIAKPIRVIVIRGRSNIVKFIFAFECRYWEYNNFRFY